MIYKSWFIVLCFVLCLFFANAQTETLNSQVFQERVKLMSQFMHRFNGDEFHPLIKSQDKDAIRNNLCQLFNIKYVTDNHLETSAFGLIDSIIAHEVKFYYEDPRWYAKATCIGTLKNQSVEFDVILVKEKNKNGYYKWAISNVIGDIFTLAPSRKTEKVYLLPDDHEIRFMRLHQITNEKDDYITYYGSDQHTLDPVSVFFTMVYTGLLNIDYVSQLEYICHQVPGYSFTIHEFEEESSNTGWLINHWTETNDDQKQAQLNFAYNNHYDTVWGEYEKTIIKAVPDVKVLLSDEEACKLINEFGKALNEYVCTPDSVHLEQLCNFIEERDSSRWLKLEKTDKGIEFKDNAEYKDFLATFTKNDIQIKHIDFNNIHVVNNFEFEDYLKNYVPISTQIQISIEGNITIDCEIIIFIEKQILGIQLPTSC